MATRRFLEDDLEDSFLADSDALSPFEQALGQAWSDDMSVYDVPQAARDVYESGGAQFPAGPVVRFDPTPDDGVFGVLSRSDQSPRERAPEAPQRPSQSEAARLPEAPRPEAAPQPATTSISQESRVSRVAPRRPSEPSPVAAGEPRPFAPLSPELSLADMVTPEATPAPGAAMQRTPIAPSIFSQRTTTPLFGYAGGLLGGGLGVPSVLGSRRGRAEPSPLLMEILQLLRGGGRG